MRASGWDARTGMPVHSKPIKKTLARCLLRGAAPVSPVQSNPAWDSPVTHHTTQRNATQRNAAQRNATRHEARQHQTTPDNTK